MTATFGGESAKILQFPKGGRAGVREARQEFADRDPRGLPIVWSGGWYHEEAIREQQAPKQ